MCMVSGMRTDVLYPVPEPLLCDTRSLRASTPLVRSRNHPDSLRFSVSADGGAQVAKKCREHGAEHVDVIPADLAETKNADTLAKTCAL